jgi:hypothetical protein
VIDTLYIALILVLALYGANSLLLSVLYWMRCRVRPPAPPPLRHAPHVTVQLPVYNEYHTLKRLVAAAVALDYPRDRLEVQILDDSTDATTELAARLAAQYSAQGLNLVHLHRDSREGFKAGALAAGLAQARGEFVAIFDADFVPPRDYLLRTLPHFADPRTGCVEARWGHLNPDYSLLTEIQTVLLDFHFVVEQPTRQAAQVFVSFNGSGGVWRRECLDQVGWSADTITEDLDLSYRAQLAGWRIVYLPDVVVPGELPIQMDALKSQQSRWAKGTVQTCLKLIGPVLRAPLPLRVKLQAFMQLSIYFTQPAMLLLFLLMPFVAWRGGSAPSVLAWGWLATAGPLALVISGQLGQPARHWRRLRVLPLLLVMGVGLCLVNSVAVLEALLRRPSTFERTPKFAVGNTRRRADAWRQSLYAPRPGRLVWVELALSVYAGASALAMATVGQWTLVPWMLLYMAGFAWTGGQSLLQARRTRSERPLPRRAPAQQLQLGLRTDDLLQPLEVHVPAADNGDGLAFDADHAAQERRNPRRA